jgi:hypothetical protein
VNWLQDPREQCWPDGPDHHLTQDTAPSAQGPDGGRVQTAVSVTNSLGMAEKSLSELWTTF